MAATSGTDLYFGIPVLAAIALGGFRALVSLVGARFGFATGLAVFVDLAFALAMRAMVSPLCKRVFVVSQGLRLAVGASREVLRLRVQQ